MTYVVASPELLTTAADNLAGLQSRISAVNAAAASSTTNMAAAAADEGSTRIAALFGMHAQEYQGISAQAALFHDRILQTLNTGAGAYSAAEAANATPLQTLEQDVLAVINAPTNALFGRPLIGDGANGVTPGGAGGPGRLLIGNGGSGACGRPAASAAARWG
jgi:hypothetical protein